MQYSDKYVYVFKCNEDQFEEVKNHVLTRVCDVCVIEHPLEYVIAVYRVRRMADMSTVLVVWAPHYRAFCNQQLGASLLQARYIDLPDYTFDEIYGMDENEATCYNSSVDDVINYICEVTKK